MLLPQSAAFAALRNRLNCVSAIGYLHVPSRGTTTSTTASYDRQNRLKNREEGGIRWNDLLEKFKSVQEKAKRAKSLRAQAEDRGSSMGIVEPPMRDRDKALPDVPRLITDPMLQTRQSPVLDGGPTPPLGRDAKHKNKSSLSNFGRLARVGGKTKK